MTPQKSESRELDKVIVRLPDGMRDKLKEAAAKNNRSMNAEIVDRLEDSFAPLNWIPDDLLARIERASARSGYTVYFEMLAALTKAFPAPFSVDNAVFEIRNYIKMLEGGAGTKSIGLLLDDLHNLAADIAEGRVEVSESKAADEITKMLHRYEAHGGQGGWEDNPSPSEIEDDDK